MYVRALTGEEAQSSFYPQPSFPENLFVSLSNHFDENLAIYFAFQRSDISTP